MEHFNESILNDEILANLKKDRIDHMTYSWDGSIRIGYNEESIRGNGNL